MTPLTILLGLSLAAYVAYTLIAMIAVWDWRRTQCPIDPNYTPGVTVLKPLRGVDAEAYSNFVSFCKQDYPTGSLQIVFGTWSVDDPALELARKLKDEFPHIDIQVVTGEVTLQGFNRKVCNLAQMLPYAKHEILVLCDSDMRVQPDYLRNVVAPLQNGASLVTCPYQGAYPKSLASVWEALGIGADFIPSALTSRLLEKVGFAFGSTIVLSKETLAELGGFETMQDHLADDFFLGSGVRKRGKEAVLSHYVVQSTLGEIKFSDMWARRLRWARTLRYCRPGGYAGSFVTHGFALATLFLLTSGFSLLGWKIWGAVLLFRFLTTAIISHWTRDSNPLRYLYLLPISDLLSFTLFVLSFMGNGLEWRGEQFRVQRDGKLVAVKPKEG